MLAVDAFPEIALVLRWPTIPEMLLDDPRVLVLDAGGRHQPDLNNFDHHQFSGGVECAFSLLLRHLGLYNQASQLYAWLGRLCHADNYGPISWGAKHGMPPPVTATFACPISGMLRTVFSGQSTMIRGTPLFELFRTMGAEMYGTMTTLDARKADLAKQMKVYAADNGYKLLQLPGTTREITQTSTQLLRDRPDARMILLCVAPGRADEVQVYRFPRAAALIPALRELFPDAGQHHKSGFLCVYGGLSIAEVRKKALCALGTLPG
jgi:hypothetical protein